MAKTIKEKVINRITNAEKKRVGRKTLYVMPHKDLLRLSKAEDSATRRLREMAEEFRGKGNPQPINIVGEHLHIEPSFVKWLQ
jgi:hypothetical protein